MSERSPNFSLPYLQADQAQKHVTLNESLRRLDALLHISVESRTLTEPPTTPQEGSRYLVAAAASGAWNGKAGQIAAFQDGAWVFYPPTAGWRIWLASESISLTHNGSEWQEETASSTEDAIGITADNGAQTKFRILTGQVTCSGRHMNAPAPIIPSYSLVLGVSARVRETITGAVNWHLGVPDQANRYGSGLRLARNNYVRGIPGMPSAYYRDTPLRVTAGGSSFTGGVVDLAIHFMEIEPPSEIS